MRVGEDTVIHPGVSLLGHTAVGAGLHHPPGGLAARLPRSPTDVTIEPYSVLDGAEVGDGCRVGPFARLRPASRLLKGARVGNFVEVKNSVLGEGAKADHLAYVGDATVGEGANIGAGVVTCNYDGVRKHPTEIGAGAFIGSDTMLVAPVKVGAAPPPAAGSVITKNVPDGALAVGRVRQKNLEGWAGGLRRRRPERPERERVKPYVRNRRIRGQREVVPLLMDGLRRLEYRGYDSAGVVAVHDGELADRQGRGQARPPARRSWRSSRSPAATASATPAGPPTARRASATPTRWSTRAAAWR